MAEYMLKCDITTATITQILFQEIITKLFRLAIKYREESFFCHSCHTQ